MCVLRDAELVKCLYGLHVVPGVWSTLVALHNLLLSVPGISA